MNIEEIRFYELSVMTVEKAMPQLLYKIYDQLHKNMLLLLANDEQVKVMDKLLWSFSSNKFLPHGTLADDSEHYAPLLLTTECANNNQSEILVSNKLGDDSEFYQQFPKQIYIFSHNDSKDYLAKFHKLKAANISSSYWQQDASGKWCKN